jgi:hypothetical protein
VAFSNVLNAVGARTSTDAWAVGDFLGPNDDDGQVMLTEHWNGSAVWAAGPAGATTSVLHWNGTSWTLETTPVGPDGEPVMKGISAVPGSATEVWAAGITLPIGGGYHTFVVHHP